MSGLEPVLLEVVRGCDFKAKPCALCGLPKTNKLHRKKNVAEGLPSCSYKRVNGCADCGRNKGDRIHYGEPPSLNIFTGSLAGPMLGGAKAGWQAIFHEELLKSGLPTGLDRVFVEGEVTFPTAAKRDQGNFRVMPEKALGDTLQLPGPDGRPWLTDDSWEFYEFGNLTWRHVPGESATRLTIFPHLNQMELT